MKEELEDNEEQLIEDLEKEFRRYYDEMYPPTAKVARRGVHPKTVALTQAEFIIEPNLPSHLQVGLFKESKRYPAYVRFSQRFADDDRKRVNRSLSIKIEHPDGVQDFLMTSSSPTFFVRNIHDFYELFLKRTHPLKFIFPRLNPLSWHLKELWLLISQNKRVSSLLTIPYWSKVPFLFGENRAMKFMVVPHKKNAWRSSIKRSANYLHEIIKQFLNSHEAYFDFLVQFYQDSKATPIEDATVKWRTPFYKVATLKIPIQDIPEEQDDAFVFDPWHTLPEHRPLGGINRARRPIYAMIAKLRQERNKTSTTIPKVQKHSLLCEEREANGDSDAAKQ